VALLDLACPGLLRKPLDATIRQLLTLYCLGGHQGNNQQTYDEKYTYFAGHFDGHRNVPVLSFSLGTDFAFKLIFVIV
jgi:hypothetical protein